MSPYNCVYECKTTQGILYAQVDADHTGDAVTCKSTTGFIIRLFDTQITWSSYLQPTVAEHTWEAEFIALNEARHDALFVAYLKNEILYLKVFPIILYEDNFAALQQASTDVHRR